MKINTYYKNSNDETLAGVEGAAIQYNIGDNVRIDGELYCVSEVFDDIANIGGVTFLTRLVYVNENDKK